MNERDDPTLKEFAGYYEATEPGYRERAIGWATAIGLQDVDGLKPSKYLIETARRNIEGEITANEARQLVDLELKNRFLRIGQEYGTKTASAIGSLHRNAAANDGINVGIYETEGRAMGLIKGNPRLTAASLAVALGVEKRHAERILAALKKKAGLKRRGSRKSGEWYFE